MVDKLCNNDEWDLQQIMTTEKLQEETSAEHQEGRKDNQYTTAFNEASQQINHQICLEL